MKVQQILKGKRQSKKNFVLFSIIIIYTSQFLGDNFLVQQLSNWKSSLTLCADNICNIAKINIPFNIYLPLNLFIQTLKNYRSAIIFCEQT